MFTKKSLRALVSVEVLTGLLLSVSIASAQMGTGRVTGTVEDTEGNPIEGATITATGPDSRTLEATTDRDGNWAILGFRTGSYEFTFAAPGFQPQAYTNNVKQMGRNQPMDVTLQKIQSGQGGGGAGGALQEANDLYGQKKYPEALAKYEEILAGDPTLYQINFNIGTVYRDMGELDKAIEHYQKVLAEEPMNTAALVSTGDVLVEQGKLDESVPYFEKAVAQTDDAVVPFNVAEIYMSQQNAAKAVEYYNVAVERRPDWAEAHLKLAYAHLNTGDMAAARASFEKVVEVAPESPQAQMAQQALSALPQ